MIADILIVFICIYFLVGFNYTTRESYDYYIKSKDNFLKFVFYYWIYAIFWPIALLTRNMRD